MKHSPLIPKCLTGFHLKVIAIVSMLADHLAYITLSSILSASYTDAGSTGFRHALLSWAAAHEQGLWTLCEGMHWFGRLAFPLFCFLLVEGFLHTRSRGKYALRLGLFALISEIPYDMAFNGCLLSLRGNNVFFTLLTGFLMLWAIDAVRAWLEKRALPTGVKKAGSVAAVVLLAAFAMALTEMVLDSSYGASGVVAVLAIYLLRRNPAFGTLVTVVALAVLNFSYVQLFALPTVLLVAMYNGQRGRSMKYFFYGFYPVHLLVCTALVAWLGNLTVTLR